MEYGPTYEQLKAEVERLKEQRAYFLSLYEPQHKQALEERDEARADNKALLDENERLKHLLSVSEDYRRAYQDGKYKLYAMGGEICEAAANHLPMSEGPLDRACRKALQPAAPPEHSEPQ